MSFGGRLLREYIASRECGVAAPVFDALSARVAEMQGWKVAKLSGSVAKAAAFGLPDDVAVVNPTDMVEVARRIVDAADIALIADGDDAGGNASAVFRTVRAYESAGVASIEIDDARTPQYYGQTVNLHDSTYSIPEQVGRLSAALEARRDDSMLVVARTDALRQQPIEEALNRIAAYAATGVDAIMLPTLDPPRDGRDDIRLVHAAVSLPIFALGLTADIVRDHEFLAEHGVAATYVRGFPAYRMALRAIDDAFRHLRDGSDPVDLVDRMVPMEYIKRAPGSLSRSAQYEDLSERFDVLPEGAVRHPPIRDMGLPQAWTVRQHD